MSTYIRSSKRSVKAPQSAKRASTQQAQPATQPTIRIPLSHAAVGLASMMLATTSASAQDVATPPKPASGTVAQQTQDAATLPKISVRAARRNAKPRQATAPAP